MIRSLQYGVGGDTEIKAEKKDIVVPFKVEKGEVIWYDEGNWDSAIKNIIHQTYEVGSYGYGASHSVSPGDGGSVSYYLHLDEVGGLVGGVSVGYNAYYYLDGFISPLGKYLISVLRYSGGGGSVTVKCAQRGRSGIISRDILSFNLSGYGSPYVAWSGDDKKFIVVSNNMSGASGFYIQDDLSYDSIIEGFNADLGKSIFFDLSLDGNLLIFPPYSGGAINPDWALWDEDSKKFVKMDEILLTTPLPTASTMVKISPDSGLLCFYSPNGASPKLYIYTRQEASLRYEYNKTIDLPTVLNSRDAICIHNDNRNILVRVGNSTYHYLYDGISVTLLQNITNANYLTVFQGGTTSMPYVSPKFNNRLHVGNGVIYDITPEGEIFPITPFASIPRGSNIYDISISPDGKYAAVAGNITGGGLRVFEFDERSGDYTKEISIPTQPTGACYGCDFSRDGMFLAVSNVNVPYIQIYRIENSELTKLENLTSPGGLTYRVKFTENNRLICSFNVSPYLAVYTQESNTSFTKLANLSAMGEKVDNFVISGDGEYLIAHQYGGKLYQIYKWDGNTYVYVKNLMLPPVTSNYSAGAMCFSPDDSVLYVGLTQSPFLHIFRNDGGSFEYIAVEDLKINILDCAIRDLAFNAVDDTLLVLNQGARPGNNDPYSAILDNQISIFDKLSDTQYNLQLPRPWNNPSSTTSTYYYGGIIRHDPFRSRIYTAMNVLSEFRISASIQKEPFEDKAIINNRHKIFISDGNAAEGEELEVYELKIKKK